MHWLCCVLVLLIGMTRQLVICKHDDGPAHLEFAHPEGSSTQHHHGGCCHDHVHVVFVEHDHGDGCEDCDDPHTSCDHVHLSVEVGPKPVPDQADLADIAACPMWLPPMPVEGRGPKAHTAQPPPSTGPPPPRPREYLALRASTVLLI